MRKIAGIAVVLVLVVAAVYWFGIRPGQRAEAFEESDPAGYQACDLFDEGLRSGGDVSSNLLRESAALGLDAETPAIRDAIDDRNGGRDGVPFYTDGFDPMREACASAGYQFE
jgi:hypothetical protein